MLIRTPSTLSTTCAPSRTSRKPTRTSARPAWAPTARSTARPARAPAPGTVKNLRTPDGGLTWLVDLITLPAMNPQGTHTPPPAINCGTSGAGGTGGEGGTSGSGGGGANGGTGGSASGGASSTGRGGTGGAVAGSGGAAGASSGDTGTSVSAGGGTGGMASRSDGAGTGGVGQGGAGSGGATGTSMVATNGSSGCSCSVQQGVPGSAGGSFLLLGFLVASLVGRRRRARRPDRVSPLQAIAPNTQESIATAAIAGRELVSWRIPRASSLVAAVVRTVAESWPTGSCEGRIHAAEMQQIRGKQPI
jgi:hypothetical protein